MKKLTILMFTMILVVTALAENTYQSCYKSGYTNYKARKNTAAIKDFDKAIELAPNNKVKVKVIFFKALVLSRLRKYKEAGNESIKILDLEDVDPNSKVKYAAKAIIYYAYAKDYDKACTIADKLSALELNEGSKRNLAYSKALAFNMLKKHDEALKVINEAIKDIPLSKRYSLDMQKARAHAGKKDNQAIVDAFPESYIKTVNPKKQLQYYYKRAMALYSLKKYEDAVKDFEACINLKPNHGGAYYYMGLCYNKLKQPEKALTTFATMKEQIKSPWGQYMARTETAKSLNAKGEYKKAVDFYKEIYENPKMSDCYKGYALMGSYYSLKKLDNKDDAIKATLEKVLKLKGAHPNHKKLAKRLLEKF